MPTFSKAAKRAAKRAREKAAKTADSSPSPRGTTMTPGAMATSRINGKGTAASQIAMEEEAARHTKAMLTGADEPPRPQSNVLQPWETLAA